MTTPYAPKTWAAGAGGSPDAADPQAFFQRMAAIEQALASVPGSSYQPQGWSGPTSGTPISAERLNDLEQAAATATRYMAPPPSGGDDTAVLQALLDAAAVSDGGRGTVQLGHGIYVANLVLNGGVHLPLLKGRGRGYTYIRAATASKPAVTLVGGPSGNLAGDGLRDVALLPAVTGGGVAIEFNNCDGVKCVNTHITTKDLAITWAEGVRFHNTGATLWTEFDVFESGAIDNAVLPIRYMADPGAAESFHGAGVSDTVIGLIAASTTVVQVDAGAFPYGAPLDATVFMVANGQALVRNQSTNRAAIFHGHVSIEFFGVTATTLASGTQECYLLGDVELLAGGNVKLGSLWQIDGFHYDGSIKKIRLKPFIQTLIASNVPVSFGNLPAIDGGDMFIAAVVVQGGGYRWAGTLLIYQAPGTAVGVVYSQTQAELVNQNGWGAPVFQWNNGLYLSAPSNGSYPTNGSVTARAQLTPLGPGFSAGRLAQN